MEWTEIYTTILAVIVYFFIGHGFQKLFNSHEKFVKSNSFVVTLFWPIFAIIASALN